MEGVAADGSHRRGDDDVDDSGAEPEGLFGDGGGASHDLHAAGSWGTGEGVLASCNDRVRAHQEGVVASEGRRSRASDGIASSAAANWSTGRFSNRCIGGLSDRNFRGLCDWSSG